VPVAALVSFRLGGTDGVSIESAKWANALGELGFDVRSVAGEGVADHLIDGLAMTAADPPEPAAVIAALSGADLVIVENLCSLPLNPAALGVMVEACRGRPTVLHHHDLPWQRPQFASAAVPDDPAWRHVTINELSRLELEERGISATTIYNRFDTAASPGDRAGTRDALGIGHGRLFLQPTRALARKNIGAGLELAARLDATYWLLGPPEDGYGPELDRLVRASGAPVIRDSHPSGRMADAYAASDLVLLPSTWEGFGNPSIESAVHRRPLCIGSYPVALELASFGFRWFSPDDPDEIARWLAAPDRDLLEHNWQVADTHFSLRDLPRRIASVLATFPDLR